jgi:hypothetical protein
MEVFRCLSRRGTRDRGKQTGSSLRDRRQVEIPAKRSFARRFGSADCSSKLPWCRIRQRDLRRGSPRRSAVDVHAVSMARSKVTGSSTRSGAFPPATLVRDQFSGRWIRLSSGVDGCRKPESKQWRRRVVRPRSPT